MSIWELFNGIQNKKVEVVERCLNAGFDVDSMYDYHYLSYRLSFRTTNTPLIYSLYLGHFEIAKLLIDKGASTNTSGAGGKTPLMQCVEKDNLEMAKYVIDMDAITCKSDSYGQTPLSLAVFNQNVNMVKLLLNNGAKLSINNVSSDNGRTPLMNCIELNNLELAKYLIDMNANTCKPDNKDITPLSLAVSKVNVEMVKLLLNNGAKSTINSTILCKALSIRRGEITKLLVQNADNSCINSSVLCEAIRVGTVEIINFLLQNCTDKTELNGKDADEDTPLIKSVRLGKFSTIKLLIQKGVDVNHKDKKGLTALSIALSNLDFRTFQFLIESGADPNLAIKEIEEMAQKNGDFAAYMESLTKNNIECKDVAPVEREAEESGAQNNLLDQNGFSGQEAAKKPKLQVHYL